MQFLSMTVFPISLFPLFLVEWPDFAVLDNDIFNRKATMSAATSAGGMLKSLVKNPGEGRLDYFVFFASGDGGLSKTFYLN